MKTLIEVVKMAAGNLSFRDFWLLSYTQYRRLFMIDLEISIPFYVIIG